MENAKKLVLGIEGGGTKTEWVLFEDGTMADAGRLSAANLRLITDESLEQLFRALPKEPTHVGAYLAGCATRADQGRLSEIAARVWPKAQLSVGSDRDSGFATAFMDRDGILVIAGTGSAVTGRYQGKFDRAGGWGQLLGDIGGGYSLAVQALRLTLFNYDVEHRVTPLGQTILHALSLNRLEDLVKWVANADKMSVAKLAPVVFIAAREGDQDMVTAIQQGARDLVEYTQAVATRLGMQAPEVQLTGGIFAHHAEYIDLFRDYVSDVLPGAQVRLCTDSGALGAAWLAGGEHPQMDERGRNRYDSVAAEVSSAATEQSNPNSAKLDEMNPGEIIDLFVSEETNVTNAIKSCREQLAEAVEIASDVLQKGGRMFYIGAGTSGRLGVLDASEIPPTFGAPPELVQGIIAGGNIALHSAVEGAEDDLRQGALTMMERGVRSGDLVVGITASGRTPFVLGALEKARETGCRTILLSCNPARSRATKIAEVEIDLKTGPEIVTGSTRLKAGTATKLALNILSTACMVRLGHVRGNRMIDVATTNAKLRHRAIRMVQEALQCAEDEARTRLQKHSWKVREAIRGQDLA